MDNVILIYNKFEQEFRRLLTPIEKEIIDSWRQDMNDDLILQALKESVYNGAVSFRYIGKILNSWKEESNNIVDTSNIDTSWLD